MHLARSRDNGRIRVALPLAKIIAFNDVIFAILKMPILIMAQTRGTSSNFRPLLNQVLIWGE